MKLKAGGYSIITLSIVAIAIASLITGLAFSQTQKSADTGKPEDGISWKPIRTSVNSLNSNFELTIPSSATDDWIIGVSPTKEGEQEEITVGLVSWESSGVSKKINFEKISNITNYPSDLIEIAQGKFRMGNSEEIAGSDESLVIFAKLSPETKVNLLKGSTVLSSRMVDGGFAIQNNIPVSMPAKGIHVLLTQLQTNRLVKAMGKRNGGKNE